jgi:hypothetical protein
MTYLYYFEKQKIQKINDFKDFRYIFDAGERDPHDFPFDFESNASAIPPHRQVKTGMKF